jgi:hypothetical protein
MTDFTPTVPTLDDLLERSSATDTFKSSVRDFAADRKFSEAISASPGSPPVKVLRAIQQLLDEHATLEVASVFVDGRSGCSDFRGHLDAHLADGTRIRFRFVWDCAWRARQEGWKTFWGDPDQQKAAQVFGYRCFESFELAG